MLTTVLWVATGVAAVVDWWSVARDRPRVEEWAKPATLALLGLVAVAGTVDPVHAKPALVVALVAGLVGDILLLGRIDSFIGGLAAFLVGHLAYLVALVQVGGPGGSQVGVAVGVTVALAAAARLPRLITSVADHHRRLLAPVVAYAAVILSMTVAALATGRPVLGLGAVLFVASDRLLAEDRFVTPMPRSRWLVHVLYHLGQFALVAGFLA